MIKHPKQILDAMHPIGEIESLGASCIREHHTVSAPMMHNQRTRFYQAIHTWTLPFDTELDATFTAERFEHKVVKLFREELQVGDELFDGRVYIKTGTREPLAELLSVEPVQSAILFFVASGGAVGMRGERLVITGGPTEQPTDLELYEEASLLAHIIAYHDGWRPQHIAGVPKSLWDVSV